MKYISLSALACGFLCVPATTYAAFDGIKGLIRESHQIVNSLIAITVACAVLVFFWGLAKFIKNAADSDSHKEGRQFMIWGIVALFVMTSVWGLVEYINRALRIPDSGIPVGGYNGFGGGRSGNGYGGDYSGGTGRGANNQESGWSWGHDVSSSGF